LLLRSVVSPAPRSAWQAVFDADAEAVPYRLAHAIGLAGGFDAVWRHAALPT
jgi:hypothetical protein